MMHGGFLKYAHEIVVGDKLMGSDSTPRTVRKIMKEEQKCYKIIQDHESIYGLAEDHIIMLLDDSNNPIDMCIKDYCQLPMERQNKLYGYKKSINFSHYNVQQDSYTYGYMLNSSGDDELAKIYNEYLFNHSIIRSQVIAGMLDASLYITKGLIEGIFIMFCNSLGIDCVFHENENSNLIKQIIIPHNHFINTYKTEVLNYKNNNFIKFSFKVVEKGIDDVYLFQLDVKDPNIVLGDFTIAQSM